MFRHKSHQPDRRAGRPGAVGRPDSEPWVDRGPAPCPVMSPSVGMPRPSGPACVPASWPRSVILRSGASANPGPGRSDTILTGSWPSWTSNFTRNEHLTCTEDFAGHPAIQRRNDVLRRRLGNGMHILPWANVRRSRVFATLAVMHRENPWTSQAALRRARDVGRMIKRRASAM